MACGRLSCVWRVPETRVLGRLIGHGYGFGLSPHVFLSLSHVSGVIRQRGGRPIRSTTLCAAFVMPRPFIRGRCQGMRAPGAAGMVSSRLVGGGRIACGLEPGRC